MTLFENIKLEPGFPSILGISFQKNLCNFALFSSNAKQVFLGLFEPNTKNPARIIPLNQTGNIWHIALGNLPEESLYAFQCNGDWNEKNGDLFRPEQWLLDPYAKIVATSKIWNMEPLPFVLSYIQKIPFFDWGDDRRLDIPEEDLIIYEMHVRGFTAHFSAETKTAGTFLAMIEKIPYLKELGINAVELMPIFEFDECHCKNIDPTTHKLLPNYWGYNPISFFAPKRSYGEINDFKRLVKELHSNGIEVILDVVYNHTGEGKEKDYALSFRGIDNQVYYMIGPFGDYRDFTGCGHTINANHPMVQELILSSLRYWAEEMHVDGFRVDLASIFTRGRDGKPLTDSPILKAIAEDPLLSSLKLIAEPWDIGLYQLGSFPKWGPWKEWNGRYRDICRRFLKGTDGKAGLFASALCGSDFLYQLSGTPLSGINFITAHDGFSLRDLVTYQSKHNWANGEMNQDGAGQNDNWNCGEEGITQDPHIQQLRERQIRNHWIALLLSQGIPMMLMGDEYGHTRFGNNNAYVQDNELNWFLWSELEEQQDIFRFVRDLISFRKNHPEFKNKFFLTNRDIVWHGKRPNQPEWGSSSRFVAFSTLTSPQLYIAFNADYRIANVHLPSNIEWGLIVDTKEGWNHHYFSEIGKQLPSEVQLLPFSSLIAKEILPKSN